VAVLVPEPVPVPVPDTLGVAEGFALAGAAGSRDMALEAWAGWRAAKRFWQDG
jgi:hypothetical protein